MTKDQVSNTISSGILYIASNFNYSTILVREKSKEVHAKESRYCSGFLFLICLDYRTTTQ